MECYEIKKEGSANSTLKENEKINFLHDNKCSLPWFVAHKFIILS